VATPSGNLAKFLKSKMPILKLTTSFIIIVGLVLINCGEVEAKREKSEQKWRSCWVTSGVKRVKVQC